MNKQLLEQTVADICQPGRGILAADESTGTIAKRFTSIQTENTEENRRFYRDMLFTTPGVEEFISGVILFEETLYQKTADGTPFAELLTSKKMVPGIKVDRGAQNMSLAPGEKLTHGLDGLSDRMAKYFEDGARFAKWRAVITIGDGIPSQACLDANAFALARYAADCQANNIVPIVEPEVIMDGSHCINTCYDVTRRSLRALFDALMDQNVYLPGALLKPNMVISGTECSDRAGVEAVAAETLRCFHETVPSAIPGIVFLSGGQSDEEATAHLNAMNAMDVAKPWFLSYSYGRALQAACLKAWSGNPDNREVAQKAFYHRARMNGHAQRGQWTEALEKELVTAS